MTGTRSKGTHLDHGRTPTDLADCSALALGRLFRSGRASPVEATAAVLRRVAAREPAINAFVLLDPEGAHAAARGAEQRFRRPVPPRPARWRDRHREGHARHGGAPHPPRLAPRRRSSPSRTTRPVVARLRSAGCVILGKTTTTEHGWSGLSSSPLTGVTHNPHRPGLTSGGSSAGAAAAAAAGMGALHLGTDGAGSVRLPAHFCGVVGFKPTFGTVPNVPLPNNDGLSHTGPIARTTRDAALMLQAIAGPHWGDPTSLEPHHTRPVDAARPLRIAYSPDLGHLRVDLEVHDAVAAAAARIGQALGAEIVAVTPPWGVDGPAIMDGYWRTVFRHHLARPGHELRQLDPAFLALLQDGADLTLAEYVALRGRRLAYAAAVNRFLEGYDLLLTPAASVTAFDPARMRPPHWPPHPHDWLAWAGFTYPFNLAHAPAIVLPAPRPPGALPVGLQLAAPRLRDGFLLEAAARIEAALAG